MVSHEQIKEILKNWKLENEKLTYVSESVYYVGDNYIIKFSPNINDVENHISVSLAIESVGLSTATPIKTITDEYVVTNSELYFYVTKRLAGKTIKTSTMNIEDYISKAALIGEIIGKLSVALSKIEVNTNQADIFTTVKEWAIPILLKKIDLPKEFIEKYEKEFGEIYESLPQQIIHRDPNPGNIILCGDNWGVLDFDLSERNIRIFDPCYATTAILSENFENANIDKLNKWIAVYKRTLYGYDEVVKISANEWKAIPYVVLSSQLISTAWFSEQEKYSELYEINKKMLDWMLLNWDNMLFELKQQREGKYMLTAHEYPIIEFDDNKTAKLNPTHFAGNGFSTNKLVITFFPEVIEKLKEEGKIFLERTISGENPIQMYQFVNSDVLITLGFVGCPSCAGNLDLFNAMGVNKVMFCGGGGVLDKNIEVGQILVVDGAIRDEGFSFHYVEPSRYIYTDKKVTDKIVGYLEQKDISYIRGITWTTDAIFREIADRIERRKAEGAKIVEMEQSGCIAVAQFRGFDYGALIYGGDDVSQEEWSNRAWRSRQGIRYDLVMLCKDLVEKL